MDITLTSRLEVQLVSQSGTDEFVAQTARVSTLKDLDATSKGVPGLINYLMKCRHGSPFEHNTFVFRINAPIFVAREFFRHRIASYNESSTRYAEMEPKFYIYSDFRPIVQEGKSAHPDLQHGELELTHQGNEKLAQSYQLAWDVYTQLIADGWALEAARACLPVGVYTSWYVTMNARSLMNFLSLRVDSDLNTYATKPQWEIEQIAIQMEEYFATAMPLTHMSFEKNGRVAP